MTGCIRTTGWITGGTVLASIEQLLRIVATERRVERLAPVRQRRDAMHRLEPVDQVAQRRGERLVRAAEIRPQRVAADLGHLIGDEQRGRRRLDGERHVGVPAGVAPAARAVELEDLRMIRVAGHHRVRRGGRAQSTSERHLGRRVEVLVAHDHDQVLVQLIEEPCTHRPS